MQGVSSQGSATLCLSSQLEDKIAYFNYRRHTPVRELTHATSALLNKLVREYEANEVLKTPRRLSSLV